MYAIVKTGGKQYRVERGQRLLVERLEADEGADVTLEPLLFRSDDAVFDKDGLADVQVTAKVLGHVRGEKLRVFKFKPKRGYKRRTGHRQELTQIEVAGHLPRGQSRPQSAGQSESRGARARSRPQARGAAPKAAVRAKAEPAAKTGAAKAQTRGGRESRGGRQSRGGRRKPAGESGQSEDAKAAKPSRNPKRPPNRKPKPTPKAKPTAKAKAR